MMHEQSSTIGCVGRPHLHRVAALGLGLVGALVGCGSSSSTPTGSQDASTPSAGAGSAGDAGAPGASTIRGSVNGNKFETASAAYAIHGADDPTNLVIYIFSNAVKCADIAAAGWDKGLPQGTQFLEIKMKSATTGPFTVVTTPTLAAGEASVNDTFLGSGGPNEQIASGGSVNLDTYAADARASGRFDIAFKTESLKGTFDASFCPGGTEP